MSSSISSLTSSTSSSLPSGMTGAGGGDMLRLLGLNTGLDEDSMVTKMLIPDQLKINSANQSLQLLQWKQQQYQTIITDVKNFQNTYFNVTTPDTNMLSPDNYSAYDISYSGDSGVATATASSGAAEGTYTLQVSQIAKAAEIDGGVPDNMVAFNDTTLTGSGGWSGGTIYFSTASGTTSPSSSNTTSITLTSFTPSTSSTNILDDLNNVVKNINSQIAGNSALNGKVTASAVSTTDASGTHYYVKFNNISGGTEQILNTTGYQTNISDITNSSITNTNIVSVSTSTKLTDLATSTPNTLSSNPLTLALTSNGTSYNVTLNNSNGDMTIGDLISAVSQQTNNQVTARLDDISGKLVLQNTGTGSSTTLGISASSNTDLLNALKLTSGTQNQGQDAIVKITSPDGNSATMSQPSNTFTANGITYNLLSPNTTSSSTTSITVASDVNTVFNNIKTFIDKYNSIVDEISEKLNEKRDYDYPPLTASQKQQMSDTDVTNWNNKAQQGLLANDQLLENMLNQMRSAFYDKINGLGLTFGPKSLGLDTEYDMSSSTVQDGKITFVDGGEDILKQAIKNNGQQVMNLFCQSSSSTNSATKYANEGIFQRINDIIVKNVGMAGVTSTSDILTSMANKQNDYSSTGSAGQGTFPDQIYSQNLLIQKLNQQYKDDEDKYYNQFSQLETAMQSISAQSAWVTQMTQG